MTPKSVDCCQDWFYAVQADWFQQQMPQRRLEGCGLIGSVGSFGNGGDVLSLFILISSCFVRAQPSTVGDGHDGGWWMG